MRTKIEKEKWRQQKELHRAQRVLFRENINKLFAQEYHHSERYEQAYVFDDGKAYINVDLTKVDTPFSIFSYDKRINQEIYDYVDSEAFYLRASIPLVVNFDDGGNYSTTMKENIKRAFIRHYSLEYEDRRMISRRTKRVGFLLLSIGIILLAVYISLSVALKNLISDNIFLELICILSWVFVWEATNRFFFIGTDRKIDVYNAGQLALMEVQFGKPVLKDKTNK